MDRPARRRRHRHGQPARRQGRRQDPDQARQPEHDLRSHDDGSPRHVRVVLCGRHPAGSGRGEVGALQVHERRRHVELHPQRLRERCRLHGVARRVQQHCDVLAARRPVARIRPVRTRRSSTRAPTHEASGGHADAGATWTQIKPSLNSAIIQTRPNLAVTTLPNGKTRMYVYEGHVGAGAAHRRCPGDDSGRGSSAATTCRRGSRRSWT